MIFKCVRSLADNFVTSADLTGKNLKPAPDFEKAHPEDTKVQVS